MARYALVIGINYEDPKRFLNLHCCTWNATEMHKFFTESGFACSRLLLESNADIDSIHAELKSICDSLKSRDTFCLYFSGYGAELGGLHHILPYDFNEQLSKDQQIACALSLKHIEEMSRKPGVQRIIIMDISYRSHREIKQKNTAIPASIQHAPKNSPIGIFWGRINRLEDRVFRGISGSAFTYALLKIFEAKAEVGLEVSFPSVCRPVLRRIKRWEGLVLPIKPPSFVRGNIIKDRIVIRPGKRTIADLPNKKRLKAETDALLEKLLAKHACWLNNESNVDNESRLTLKKLEPIIKVYQNAGFGTVNLARQNLKKSIFCVSILPENIDFSYSDLSGANMSYSSLSNINFSGCTFTSTWIPESCISNCNFAHSLLENVYLDKTAVLNCIFDHSSISETRFFRSTFIETSFRSAVLHQLDLSNWTATGCDFTCADLTKTNLVGANLSKSILTGAKLYGTARTDWRIDGVKCQYVYWDKDGQERFPPSNDFEKREFSTQYRTYAEFSYAFKKGITPVDLMLATHIVNQINKADTGFKIRIDNASLRGLNPTLNFIMESGDEKRDEAQKLFKAEYECRIALLEEKLQSSKTLLTEQGRRTDLAEQQLSEITALAKSGTSELTAFRQFSCLMENFFKEGGLISQYAKQLKSTADSGVEDIANFSSKDLGKYDYLILVNIPDGKTDIDELNLMRSTLERFMKHKVMVVFSSELEQVPNNAFVRSTYGSVFGKKQSRTADIAVATVHKEVNERLYMNPLRHELLPAGDSRVPFLDALNRSLENLRFSIEYASIEDVPLPELHHTLQGLVVPNGCAVKECRERQRKNQTDFAAECGLDRKTISRIENGNPVKLETMQMIADKTDKTADELLYTRVVPLRKKLIQMREDSGVTPDETAQKTGLPSGSYIQQLENATHVSARVMRVVHHLYEKHLLEKSIPFSDLIDLDATEKLSI